MKKIFYLSLILLAFLTWRDWNLREIDHPPGVLVPEAPRQQATAKQGELLVGDFQLTPRAGFQLRARVLSREDYKWGKEAELSPMDLALGWGVMSDQSVLNRIKISQRSRWYYTRYELPAPIPEREISRHSSNMHIIPANELVRAKLKKIRRGDIVQARGLLVDVDQASGFQWRTSLSRDDTGSGACEIFYLEQLFIEPHN